MNIKNISLDIIAISITFVFGITISLIFLPETSLNIINTVFDYTALLFGTPLLWFSLICTILCFYFSFSSYGKIKLGDGNPDYSTFSYIAMMICAGLASASVYFSFIEWVFFYNTPALGITPQSNKSLEWAPAYSFMYWGINSWPPFAIAALPIAISYYKRGNKGLRFSIVWEDLFGLKKKSISGKIIDILFIITTLGGLSVTLGLGIPLISFFISYILGISDSFILQLSLIIIIALIFSFSSYMGISKGMKVISDCNIYLAIFFVFSILVLGPTFFIFKYTTNGLGLVVQNYIHMLFATAPIEADGFSEQWTIFYICLAVAYAPLMSLFITKISRGRTIREMLLYTVFGGSFGCIVLFGINGGFSVYAQSIGLLDIASVYQQGNNGRTILEIVSLLPISNIITSIINFIPSDITRYRILFISSDCYRKSK